MGLSSSKNKNKYLLRQKPFLPDSGRRSPRIRPYSRSIGPQIDYNYLEQPSSTHRNAQSYYSYSQIPIIPYSQLAYRQTGCPVPIYPSPMLTGPIGSVPMYPQLLPQSFMPYGTPITPVQSPFSMYQPFLQSPAQSFPQIIQPQQPLIFGRSPVMMMAPSALPFQFPYQFQGQSSPVIQPMPVYNPVPQQAQQQQPQQQFVPIVTDWTGGGQISPGFLGPPL
ncbi:unnamed protein product [Didymodactylos carnosus]|uniref:Uncharacterized protein n=1 Tax=Didymodactylos carnosus TaxID=1234261 RepID=A0A814JB84_9BILA|nr:unnamed protein product [Didymodactylos carnosus]CAF3805788.1 unnamed protein product [Didymodactylos carnosus]